MAAGASGGNAKPAIEILVGVLGGAEISKGSGKLIRKTLKDIGRDIGNDGKSTHITFHVNTAASQKAIQSELKKLNLAVNITPRQTKQDSTITKTIKDIQKLNKMKIQLNGLDQTGQEAMVLQNRINKLQGVINADKRTIPQNRYKTEVEQNAQVVESNELLMQSYARLNDQQTKAADKTASEKLAQDVAAAVQHSKQLNSLKIKLDGLDQASDEAKTLKQQIADLDALIADDKTKIPQADYASQVEGNRQVIDSMHQLEVAQSKNKDATLRNKENETITWGKLTRQVQEYYQQVAYASARSPELSNSLKQLMEQVQSKAFTGGPKAALQEFLKLQAQFKALGIESETLGQKITRVFTQKFGFGIMAAASMQARNALRLLYQNVVEIDSAMTQLRIVTEDTAETYRKFAGDVADAAQEVGASVTALMNSTETYARLGYSLDDSLILSTVTAQYANVAAVSQDEATTALTAILKGFGIDATGAERVADILTEVGKKYAISAGELGVALENGGAAMAAANNSLEQSVALLAAGNAAVQDASKVGNAFKTTTMRIRGATAEDLEEAGLATDGLCESTSKLRSEIKALSGVDIMKNANEFKSTYDIMLEVAQVWDSMSDINQAALLEDLAGKRNATVLMSTIMNLQDLTGAYEDAANAAGTMAQANDIYLESIAGKQAQLSAAYQELSDRVLSNEIIEGLMEIARALLNVFNTIDEQTNGAIGKITTLTLTIGALIIAISALSAASTMLGLSSTVAAISAAISSLSTAIFGAISRAGVFVTTLAGVSSWQVVAVLTMASAIALIGIEAAKAYRAAHPSLEALREDYASLNGEISALQTDLDENNAKIKELLDLPGELSLVDEAEVKRLREENGLLEAQIASRKEIAEQKKNDLSNTARRDAAAYLSAPETVTSYEGVQIDNTDGVQGLKNAMTAYQEAKDAYATATMDEQAGLTVTMDKNADIMEAALTTLQGYAEDLSHDPTGNADLIAQINDMLNRIQLTLGGTDSAQNVIDRIFQAPQNQVAVTALKNWANAVDTTGESLQSLVDVNPAVAELINYLVELGLLDLNNTDGLVTQLKEVQTVAEDTVGTLADISDAVSAIADRKALLNDVKEEAASGAISDSTLDSMQEQYKAMELINLKYKLGLILAKDVYAEYARLYAEDEKEFVFKNALKIAFTEEYFNQSIRGQKTYTDILGEYYTADFENFQELAQKKLDIENLLIKKLGSNWSGYFKTYAEALTVAYKAVDTESEWNRSKDNGGYAGYDNYQQWKAANTISSDEYERLMQTATSLDNLQSQLEEDLHINVPDIGKNSSSGKDAYLEAVKLRIAKLKYQYEVELITAKEYYDGLEAIENAFYKNSPANAAKYAEEILDIDKELFEGRRELFSDWMNDQEHLAEAMSGAGNFEGQQKAYEDLIASIKTQIDAAKAYGLDENSDYMQELRKQLKDYQEEVLEIISDTFESFVDYADDFNLWDDLDFTKLDVLEEQLRRIDSLYEKGELSWKAYVEAHNDVSASIYDTQKDALDTILDLTMEMIRQESEDAVDALEKQKDAYADIIELKKELLQEASDEKDHEREVADTVREIAELQSKIAQLSLDDSREATAQRAQLEEELYQKQQDLADLQSDYALETTLDTLDKSQEAFEDEKDAETEAIEESIDTWVKVYQKAIARINKNWDTLYDDLMDYQKEYRDSVDGIDSLVTAWDNATAAVQRYNNSFEDAYAGIENENAMNPSSGLANNKELSGIVQQMHQNSIDYLLTSDTKQKATIKQNQSDLVNQFNSLAGTTLKQGADGTWYLGSDTLYSQFGLSDIDADAIRKGNSSSSSSGTSSGTNPYPMPSSNTILQKGSTGSAVSWVQYQLNKALGTNLDLAGHYWTDTQAAVYRFQEEKGCKMIDGKVGPETLEKLKKYHTGGIVGGEGAINDSEVLAILKRGELVLNDQQKAAFKSVLGSMADVINIITAGKLRGDIRANTATPQTGDTYAPTIQVTINHDGTMSDSDVRAYGNTIADTALEKLRVAFVKRGI